MKFREVESVNYCVMDFFFWCCLGIYIMYVCLRYDCGFGMVCFDLMYSFVC